MNYTAFRKILLESDVFVWSEDAAGEFLDPGHIVGIYGSAENKYDIKSSRLSRCFFNNLVSSCVKCLNAPSPNEQIKLLDDASFQKAIRAEYEAPLSEVAKKLKNIGLKKLSDQLNELRKKISEKVILETRRHKILKGTGVIDRWADQRREFVLDVEYLIEKYVPTMTKRNDRLYFAANILSDLGIENGEVDSIRNRLNQDYKTYLAPFKK